MARAAPIALLALVLGASGCASFGRGLGEALVGGASEDTRACQVRGPAFPGLERFMQEQEEDARQGRPNRALKIMMVHGIGSHRPGHGTRLAENLAAALDLPMTKRRFREFELEAPAGAIFGDPRGGTVPVGWLRVSRFFNEDFERDLFFYELTWDSIVEEEKQNLAYDTSGEESFRRAGLNDAMKRFVNDTVPDVMMYKGSSKPLIQASVGQTLCWMVTKRWGEIPDGGRHRCDPRYHEMQLLEVDELVFFSHSLGSRIAIDSFQALLATIHDPRTEIDDRIRESFRNKRFLFFMLSNQLPLLQLGASPPAVHDRIRDYCRASGARYPDRWVREVSVIAFSDPNDVMSYTLRPGFLDRYVDSRLCPSAVNVLVNVAPTRSLFGVGELADPYRAHVSYDDDERVIALAVGGIGGPTTVPIVEERCSWLEQR